MTLGALGTPKHVGIVAHSFEGAALCYRTMCLEGMRLLGAHSHPEITLTGVPMHGMMDAWQTGDHAPIRARLYADIEKLRLSRADFFVCPDNTAHIALEMDGPPFSIPGLNIADVVAEQAVREGRRTVGIVGTEWTMTGPVYRRAFGSRDIHLIVPGESDRQLIHHAIFAELCMGIFNDSTRRTFIEIIQRLADGGCDAVALVCTEVPILVTAEVSPLPILDSTRLLACAAVSVALGSGEMPRWRSGLP